MRVPIRSEVNKALSKFAVYDKNFDLNENSLKVFNQYGHVKAYCTDKELLKW